MHVRLTSPVYIVVLINPASTHGIKVSALGAFDRNVILSGCEPVIGERFASFVERRWKLDVTLGVS